MLIFVQVCRTIDKKFSVFKSIDSEEQMRAMKSTKRKLLLQGSILKKRGSEDKRF
jgi:hypothetical protein